MISTRTPAITAQTLGEQMREARHDAGLTQAAVARRLFVVAGTVKNWELGYRTPSVVMLDRYLRAVGGSIVLGEVHP